MHYVSHICEETFPSCVNKSTGDLHRCLCGRLFALGPEPLMLMRTWQPVESISQEIRNAIEAPHHNS